MKTKIVALILMAFLAMPVYAGNSKFLFKIKTKSGTIIGNILINAKDVEGAKFLLNKRYPNSQILGVRNK